jgi:hypothetical protein
LWAPGSHRGLLILHSRPFSPNATLFCSGKRRNPVKAAIQLAENPAFQEVIGTHFQ